MLPLAFIQESDLIPRLFKFGLFYFSHTVAKRAEISRANCKALRKKNGIPFDRPLTALLELELWSTIIVLHLLLT
jgi:hypothetical protein